MLQTLGFLAGGRTINAKADFFRYESCSANGADEGMRVRADGNDLGIFLPGDYVNLPAFATSWELVPVTATATGTVRLGVGRVGSSRITGNVKVVDQAADKTIAGKQFAGSASPAADPALVTCTSISPMTGRLAIRWIGIQSDVAGDVLLWRGTGPGTATVFGGATFANKYSGGASGNHRVVNGLLAATQPTAAEMPGTLGLGRIFIPANQLIVIPYTTPIVLEGAAVLMVSGVTINRRVSWYLDVEELT